MILPAYAATLIGSQSVRDILDLRSIGATMSNLNAGIVASLQLPCPPVEEQQKILAFLSLESERSKAAGDLARVKCHCSASTGRASSTTWSPVSWTYARRRRACLMTAPTRPPTWVVEMADDPEVGEDADLTPDP